MKTLPIDTNASQHTVLERFLRYVTFDTQSDPNSSTFPSTAKQKNLSRQLVEELKAMGVADAELDEFGYVFATIPSNSEKNNIPTICFCSHVDTSPDCSGEGVKPLVHQNYNGTDIVLPDDEKIVIRTKDHPHLKEKIGHDIVTASGTTLLGADNKSGVAAIMDAAHFLIKNPHIKHGKVRILFTPDEEIGMGVSKLDMKKLNADFGYTVDGEFLGSLEDETFSADLVKITIHGVSAHPGFAKGKMENAIKIAGKILAQLPNELSPEHTSEREGFLHPLDVKGNVEQATISLIIRDFETNMLKHHEAVLEKIVKQALADYPNCSYDFQVIEQYRNMKEVLDQYPQVADYAAQAIKRAGLTPIRTSIRGGTDGSRLSFMGLPCPNIFAGEYAFHSKYEWASVQDMEKAVETILHLCCIWEENA